MVTFLLKVRNCDGIYKQSCTVHDEGGASHRASKLYARTTILSRLVQEEDEEYYGALESDQDDSRLGPVRRRRS